jgi:hypothetical protein
MQKPAGVWTFFIGKSISSQVDFQNLLKCLQKLAQNKQNFIEAFLFYFDSKLKIWIFKCQVKNFVNKKSFDFFEVSSKEIQGNTEEKVGLRQPDISKF